MKQPKLTRSEYDAKMKAKAKRLIHAGRIPPLDELLAAIEDGRKKYRQRIADARERTR